MGELIDGSALAAAIEQQATVECAQLAQLGVAPALVAVEVGSHPASALYMKRQRKACVRVGIGYRTLSLPEESSEQDLLRELSRLNANPQVTGIILQMPLPGHVSARAARRALQPEKDVEGVHPQNLGWLLSGRPTLVPCTAEAVLECILATGVPLEGTEAVVVGHSEIVGRPVALLLMERLATVTVCHVATRDLTEHVQRAELLVVAAGRPHLVAGRHVRSGCCVVDVGINEVRRDGGRAVLGDVETDAARERAAWITPVPGGVGPVTVAVLMRNTVKAAASQGPLAL